MKPKVVAMIIVAILAVSMVLTVVAAVDQAVSGEVAGLTPTQQIGQGSDDGSLVRTLKFVCPFH
ncbi:MAG: hypothetical protein BZY75_01015 [SAR202 cluster bacterium Io17-Chloro-G7]|nr:MAG: hypothetical protein BZY75_01015 [SAR202 cluster bacterium Io17-Chloro-G7]